jgi:SRSO17 transposase
LIGARSIILCIDETGDRKAGKTTDYVAKQYIGNLGKTANGIVKGVCLCNGGWHHLSISIQSVQTSHATTAR